MISKREFLKLIAGSFAVFLPWKDIYGETKKPEKSLQFENKYPKTIDELIALLEYKYPHQLNIEKLWDEYFTVGNIPDIPSFVNIKYLKPKIPEFTGKIKHSEIYYIQWKTDDPEYEKECIRKVYDRIVSDAIKCNARSVNWKIKPEIERLIDFQTRTLTKRLYAKAIFI